MTERDVDYRYPPPSRSRKTKGSNLTIYKCANCGRFGAHKVGTNRYKCLFCKSVVEYRFQNGTDYQPPTLPGDFSE